MHQTILQFPQIKLQRRDGHKLRGYFAQLFGEDSDLFHNHQADGKVIYRYPLIQYKVIMGMPTLVGINEGAKLLTQRFIGIQEIVIDDENIPTESKNLKSLELEPGVNGKLYQYEFVNPWLPLNQDNWKEYKLMKRMQQQEKLSSILINNFMHFFKGIGHWEENQIMVNLQLEEPRPVWFKNTRLLGYTGCFVTNVKLPDWIGLGKSPARGFGTIQQKTH